MILNKIMKLLAHLVELDLKRKDINDSCLFTREEMPNDEMYDAEMEAIGSKAKNIMTDAMGLAHSIGCTIWCDAKRDHTNYQLIGSKGAVIDQTR